MIKDGGNVTTDARAKTVFDGVRKIYLTGDNFDGTVESALAMGIALQHEAYRDGITESSAAQQTETMHAIYKHTEMALRMANDGMTGKMMNGVLSYMPELKSDIGNYNRYMFAMARAGGDKSKQREAYEQYAAYVNGAYDSSEDYWKLLDDGTLVWDGKRDLVNEHGEIIRLDKTKSYSKSLLNWLGNEAAIAFLTKQGIDTTGMSRDKIAESLFTSLGIQWDNNAVSPLTGKATGAWVDLNNNTDLSSFMRFKLPEKYAFHLGKISQESPDIAYWVGSDEKKVNAMKATGCYYMSTLGAVQTQADKLLSAEDINYITAIALKNNWLQTNDVSIWPNGAEARESISKLAFMRLGKIGYGLKFVNPRKVVGKINVGQTIWGNNHATEWNLNQLLFDPYQGIRYSNETKESLYYSVTKSIRHGTKSWYAWKDSFVDKYNRR